MAIVEKLLKEFRTTAFVFICLIGLGGCANDDKPVTVIVPKALTVFDLQGNQENPPVATDAEGSGSFDLNLDDGSITGSIATSGVVATAAHIHSGFAGRNGGVIVTLERDTVNSNRWLIPEGTALSAAQMTSYQTGGLYVNVHSDAFPGGEIRAQLLTFGYSIRFTNLSGDNEVPAVNTPASGRAGCNVPLSLREIIPI